MHKRTTGTTRYTYFASSLNRKLIRQRSAATLLLFDHHVCWLKHVWNRWRPVVIEAQSPRIHLQCWHLKHLMFILWRWWDNPLSERHKHSTLGTWLLVLYPIQPIWLQRTVGFTQDNSSPKVEHWKKRRQREMRPYGNLNIITQKHKF